ncbi:MAG TPA: hypothetical protein VI874_04050, partial [Candidatus Norongarragalinales archaeon]|nr:hypothetical protein [Candidatus Norongarragalinales archaeon]
HDVKVECGNGQTAQVTCPGVAGTCSASCTFGQEGLFTPSALIGGASCNTASSTVRVLSTTQNTCTLFASPNSIDRSGTVTVTANYNSLTTPVNGTLLINCGNGVTVNASNCNGNTGACSTACSYPNEGNYVITASTGSVSCAEARVAVANPSIQSCLMSSSPSTIIKGESASVTLRYSNLPISGSVSSALPVPILAGTQNLLVNLVDDQKTLVLSTAELDLEPIPPAQVFPGTVGNIPVTVGNSNYFTIDSILVYVKNTPPGVVMTPPAKFSLNPGERKSVFIRAEATQGALLGTRQIDIVAESPLTLAKEEKMYFSVLASPTAQLNVAVRIVSSAIQNGSVFIVDTTVRNNEPVALALAPSLLLPQGWTFSVVPQTVSIAPNGEAVLQSRITAFNPEPGKEYNATLSLSSSDGRTQRIPFTLTPRGGDILSGFVTLGDSILGAGFAVFLLLVAVAAFLLAGMHQHRRRT